MICFLIAGGLFSGLLAGLLGIGGGTILVPLLVHFGYSPLQAVATSSLAIVITSISGSIQNWRMGYLDLRRVFSLGLPAIITAQWGAILAEFLPNYLLLTIFAWFLLGNIFLSNLRQHLKTQQLSLESTRVNRTFARLLIGGVAGGLAGLFGVGGGVIMVPFQMLLLGENIKVAIQTSLGVIVITAISAVVAHIYRGNIVVSVGMILGIGGLIGAQITTRFLPKLSEKIVSVCFNILLLCLAVYIFIQAWQIYN